MSASLTNLRQSLLLLLEQAEARQDGREVEALRVAQTQIDALEAELAPGEEQKRLAALYAVSQALGSSLDLDEVLNEVMDAAIRLTGAERGFIVLLDDSGGEPGVRAARNFQRETLPERDAHFSRTVVSQVVASGEPVVTTNAQADPRFAGADSVVNMALRSIMAGPLRARGKTIGVVYVDNKIRAGLFSESHLKLLAAFATQAAVAIENARLYTLTDEALRQRVAELQTMQAIDRELNTSLNFDRVMQIAVERAVRGTGATAGWIGMLDAEANALRLVASVGLPDGGRPATIPANTPRLGPVLTWRKPARLTASLDGTARLVVPIQREDRAMALIEVERPKVSFSEEAEAFLARLADHAAIAIENARLYEAVRQANEAKSQFVSVVSHELKIPMTSIKGYTDLLRQGMAGPISDPQRQMLNTIRSNVDRMAVLVSDLSDISRIETGRLKLEIGAVALADAIEETLVGLRPAIEGKNQNLTVNVPPDLPPVRADRARLVQVLTNLVSNANKYTPPAGQVLIGAARADGFARVTVADSGIGISPADQAKLFSQFFRSDDPAVREQTGWGLGLNITKRLIELLGGQISMTSAAGKGSAFTFTVPLA